MCVCVGAMFLFLSTHLMDKFSCYPLHLVLVSMPNRHNNIDINNSVVWFRMSFNLALLRLNVIWYRAIFFLLLEYIQSQNVGAQ